MGAAAVYHLKNDSPGFMSKVRMNTASGGPFGGFKDGPAYNWFDTVDCNFQLSCRIVSF